MVDLDLQGNGTTSLGVDKWGLERTIYDVLVGKTEINDAIIKTAVEGLDLAPTKVHLSGAEVELVHKIHRESIRKSSPEQCRQMDHSMLWRTNRRLCRILLCVG